MHQCTGARHETTSPKPGPSNQRPQDRALPTSGQSSALDPLGPGPTLQETCSSLGTSLTKGQTPATRKLQPCSLWIWPTDQQARSCLGTSWSPALPTGEPVLASVPGLPTSGQTLPSRNPTSHSLLTQPTH